MTDQELKQTLLLILENQHAHQVVLDETKIVVQALYRSLCQKFPDFDAIYSKHHQQLTRGPQGAINAAILHEIAAMIEELKNHS